MAYENILNTIETLDADINIKRKLLNAALGDIANEKNNASISDLTKTQKLSKELQEEEEKTNNHGSQAPPSNPIQTIQEMAAEARLIK